MPRVLVPTVVLLLAVAFPAALAIDVTGTWIMPLVVPFFPATCVLNFVQSGTDLSIDGDCGNFIHQVGLTGTIDPTSGVFHAVGANLTSDCTPLVIDATVSADGLRYSGTTSCTGFPGPADGTRCGNGVLDAGEPCDGTPCCTEVCQLLPAGSPCVGGGICDATGMCGVEGEPCDDGSPCTVNDVRQADGTCAGTPIADSAACDDGVPCSVGDTCHAGVCVAGAEDTCAPCGRCDATARDCVPVVPLCSPLIGAVGRLHIAYDPAGERDGFRFSRLRDHTIAIGNIGDPRATTHNDICIYEGVSGDPLLYQRRADRTYLNVDVPPNGTCSGGPCWKALARSHGYALGDGFAYADREGRVAGIRSMREKTADLGPGAIRIRAKGSSLALRPPPLELPVLVQVRARGGTCTEALFTRPRRNDGRGFEARSAIPGFAE